MTNGQASSKIVDQGIVHLQGPRSSGGAQKKFGELLVYYQDIPANNLKLWWQSVANVLDWCMKGSVMEVEVKLRLPSAEAHAKIAKLLEPNHGVTHLQENVFFDGANEEL